MVNIENIDLYSRGVELPADRVGLVVAQPFLSLTTKEPFVCTPDAVTAQLAMIERTIEIAKTRPHGQPKTHFTIFPEYSIPGVAGIAAIDAAVAGGGWPTGTIVIGGVAALTKDDYVTLTGEPNTSVNLAANAGNSVKAKDWLNCTIIWVKGANGIVERWIQPKLYPAWEEQNVHYQHMFRGGSIFIFRGRLANGAPYRFSILICFDWIATVDGKLLWRQVLEELERQAAAAEAESSLSWFFVVQHNKKPSHDAFLNQIPPFFDETSMPTVHRNRACVMFSNTAGKPTPGKTDVCGGTSLVFSSTTNFAKPECSMTFSAGGPSFQNHSTIIRDYYDVFFRERGACILSFVQVNPGSVAAGAANRAIAVERAELFPIGDVNDPRVPSAAVPASVKWLNDELDDLPSLATILGTAPLKDEAAAIFWLKTRARWTESSAHELSGKDGQPIRIEISAADAGL